MTIPMIVAVIGIILYFATEGKPSEVGRVAFFCGLFATLIGFAGMRVF